MATIKKGKHSTVVLKFEVTQDMVQKAENKVLEKYRKTANIKGFRKGKVPMERIKQMIKPEAVAMEARTSAIDAQLQKAAVEHKLHILSLVENKGMDGDKFPLKLEITAEIYPEIVVNDIEKISFTEPTVEVKDADVDTVLEQMMMEIGHGKEVKRAAKKGDVVEAAFSAVDEKGAVIPSTKSDGMTLKIGEGQLLEDLEKAMIKMKAGEAKEDVAVKFPKEYHSADFAGKTLKFSLTLNKVIEINAADADDAFVEAFQKIRGGEMKDIAQLKENIEKHLEQQKMQAARKAEMQKFEDAVLKNTTGELPQSWITGELGARLARLKDHWQYKADPEQYWQQMGTDEKKFTENLTKSIDREYKIYMAYKSLIEQKKITLTAEQEQIVEFMAKQKLQQKNKQGAGAKLSDEMDQARFSMLVNEVIAAMTAGEKPKTKAKKATKKATKKEDTKDTKKNEEEK